MKTIKEWRGFLLLVLVMAVVGGALIWFADRPVELKAEELYPAETLPGYPGTELCIQANRNRITGLTFANESDAVLEFGAAVGANKTLYCDVGVQILLDGLWYNVPFEEYATAGVGIELYPGERFGAEPILEPYGKLPDGQYRLAFGYSYSDPSWEGATVKDPSYRVYASYVRFDVSDGVYVLPEDP